MGAAASLPTKAGNTTRKRKPRGRFGTIAKLMMFVADYWLGYWLPNSAEARHSQ